MASHVNDECIVKVYELKFWSCKYKEILVVHDVR